MQPASLLSSQRTVGPSRATIRTTAPEPPSVTELTLPNELLSTIWEYSATGDARDVVAMATTCKFFYALYLLYEQRTIEKIRRLGEMEFSPNWPQDENHPLTQLDRYAVTRLFSTTEDTVLSGFGLTRYIQHCLVTGRLSFHEAQDLAHFVEMYKKEYFCSTEQEERWLKQQISNNVLLQKHFSIGYVSWPRINKDSFTLEQALLSCSLGLQKYSDLQFRDTGSLSLFELIRQSEQQSSNPIHPVTRQPQPKLPSSIWRRLFVLNLKTAQLYLDEGAITMAQFLQLPAGKESSVINQLGDSILRKYFVEGHIESVEKLRKMSFTLVCCLKSRSIRASFENKDFTFNQLTHLDNTVFKWRDSSSIHPLFDYLDKSYLTVQQATNLTKKQLENLVKLELKTAIFSGKLTIEKVLDSEGVT